MAPIIEANCHNAGGESTKHSAAAQSEDLWRRERPSLSYRHRQPVGAAPFNHIPYNWEYDWARSSSSSSRDRSRSGPPQAFQPDSHCMLNLQHNNDSSSSPLGGGGDKKECHVQEKEEDESLRTHSSVITKAEANHHYVANTTTRAMSNELQKQQHPIQQQNVVNPAAPLMMMRNQTTRGQTMTYRPRPSIADSPIYGSIPPPQFLKGRSSSPTTKSSASASASSRPKPRFDGREKTSIFDYPDTPAQCTQTKKRMESSRVTSLGPYCV